MADFHVGDSVTVGGLLSGPTPVGRVVGIDGQLAQVRFPPRSWTGADGEPVIWPIQIAATLNTLVAAGE